MGKIIKDEELREYRSLIGSNEYHKQYLKYYQESKQKKSRFSGEIYDNSAERLQEIKAKYRNGVTQSILEEFAQKML